jgi:hypothetical protein
VLKGRFKAKREETITLAHQSEAMARVKRLRPLDHYLSQRKRIPGTDPSLFPMLEALQAKGMVTIREVVRD